MKDRRKQSRDFFTPAFRRVGLMGRAVLGPPARAARGTARRVADPARQIVDYWGSERRTMRQGFVAVVIASMTSLLSGLTLVGMEERLRVVPGLLMLVPAAIGMRGNIFGALAARLGTSIHSGLFEVSRARDGSLFQNVAAAATLTVGTSVAMGLLARAIAGLLDIHTVPVWDLILVALVAGVLSSVVVAAATIYISISSFKRGWDLDSVGAPLITAIGDVMTLPCLWLASYLSGVAVFTPLLGMLGLAAGIATTVLGWSYKRDLARRILRESFPILCVAIVLDVFAGTVVEPRVDVVFSALPAFLIV
ncbi:MAG: magnesium transporter, partial [Actinomycetota bacterium]